MHKKNQCILVSQDSSQYMMDLVLFEFKNRQAAANATKTLGPNSIWEVSCAFYSAQALLRSRTGKQRNE